MLGRRGTADDLQGSSRRQALTILHTSVCDKAGHCDFTGRMLTRPVRPGPETSRPGPARSDFQNYGARPERAGPGRRAARPVQGSSSGLASYSLRRTINK